MSKGGWYGRNRVQARESRKKYWQTERGKQVNARAKAKYHRRVTERTRALVDSYKSKPCMDCGGVFDPVCMDFDHRPGEEKRFCVSQWSHWSKRVTIAVLLAEIAKCDVVCANCHRVRTFRLRNHRDTQPENDNASELQLGLFDSTSEGEP